MAEFKKVETPIEGLFVIEPTVFGDARGFFMETYAKRDFDAMAGSPVDFVQDNHSKSRRGVLRGLHFQTQHAQGKLIRVVAGAVYDVAVDLRAGSPTYGRWHGVELSAENHKQIYVPRGFAHGFITLTEEVEVQYKADNYYAPECDGNICWNDPEIGILWPVKPVKLSDKDAKAPRLRDRLDSLNFVYEE